MKTTLASLLIVLLYAFAAVPASAQIPCYQCDPNNSGCSDACWYCELDGLDGYCDQQNVVQSTCGDRGLGNPPCAKDGCTPNWIATSLENRGTYGEGTYDFVYVFPYSFNIVYSCEHHSVDLVTEQDVNECNQNPGFWTKTECIDNIDATKGKPTPDVRFPFPFLPRDGHNAPPPGSPTSQPQDCCNGLSALGQPEPLYTCNHYHACY